MDTPPPQDLEHGVQVDHSPQVPPRPCSRCCSRSITILCTCNTRTNDEAVIVSVEGPNVVWFHHYSCNTRHRGNFKRGAK
ncbi:hypothetical protein E2C01_019450 [Portunus trituberculatus]|uniref:Uncharacterized protein n=1 Tax=Portunus trituberculatus TaxID=210409 RepID=A0A5B7DZD7_PORTR|nr:hypothetical protein [Portunus trituberculatus]